MARSLQTRHYRYRTQEFGHLNNSIEIYFIHLPGEKNVCIKTTNTETGEHIYKQIILNRILDCFAKTKITVTN